MYSGFMPRRIFKPMEKILVTSALPYANGPIHIGHIAGAYLPADIFVRFCRLMHKEVVYICGTDEHGVPITISADQEKTTPQAIVDKYHAVIKKSFEDLNISFDHFSRTTIPIHYKISQQFFTELNNNGYISTQTEKQLFCPACNRFLPDRYVEGTCPQCDNPNARGDECPKCGKWLEATQLKNPLCKLCGSTPQVKETKHWYLNLNDLQTKLETWIDSKNWKENVKNFVLGWFKEGLAQRPITRDLNWGIPVPLPDAKGKVLYVWFDAPIGYISITAQWAEKIGQPKKWKDYWLDKNTKLVHFIGKDNIPFHAIVWPAMIMGQTTSYVLPSEIPANEHLTIEGEKISTSKGNTVGIDEFLNYFPADYLRYYLATNAPENKDADFSWKNFQNTLNNELINVVANLANRALTFIYNQFDKTIPAYNPEKSTPQEKALFQKIEDTLKKAKTLYEQFKVREACREILDLAREGNQFFQEKEPWKLIKTHPEETGNILNLCVQVVEVLALLYYPIIPESSLKLWQATANPEDLTKINLALFTKSNNPAKRVLEKPSPLFQKVEDKTIQLCLDLLQNKIKKCQEKTKPKQNQDNLLPIELADFKKIELKTGLVIEAQKVEKSDKLLKMKVAIGNEERQIVGGLALHYTPQEIIGKTVVVVTNLKPAKLMGIESQGMLLATKTQKNQLKLLTVDGEVSHGLPIS